MTGVGSAISVGPNTRRFLDQVMPAIVGTIRRSGLAKLTPVWYKFAGNRFWLNGWSGAHWLDQILAQERASLLFVDPGDMHRTVYVEADLASATTAGAHDALHRMSRRYRGHDYRTVSPRTRVLVELEPVRLLSSID